MVRRMMLGVWVTAVLATAGRSAGAKLHDLSKRPRYRVGDRVTVRHTSDATRSIVLDDGRPVRDNRERKESRQIFEVLEVDSAGRVLTMRRTIVVAKFVASGKKPGGKDYKKEIAIEKIHFVVRRNGLTFDADTTTVVSEKSGKLKATQIIRLKSFCRNGIRFRGGSEVDAMLLPAKPVAVGATWKPSPAAVKKWVDVEAETSSGGYKAIGAEFRLVSVDDGVAVVEGTVRVEIDIEGQKAPFRLAVTGRIETSSGRWLQRTTAGSVTVKFPRYKATAKMVGRGEESFVFAARKGAATKLPKKRFALGWKPPGEDTNNYKNAKKGVSIDVPDGFKAEVLAKGDASLVRFAGKANSNLSVSQDHPDEPPELDDFARELPLVMRKEFKDYAITESKEFALGGNVPALLQVGKGHKGVVTMIMLVALEGSRVVTVAGAFPTAMTDMHARMRKAVTSLRLFDKDAGKPSPAKPAPEKPKTIELPPVKPKSTTDP